MRRRRKPTCPLCGSRRSVPVVYGTPLAEDVAKAEAGLLVLGGMNLHADAPDFVCTDCQNAWRVSVGTSGSTA